MSKGGEEGSLGSEDLNPVVVLVRDEDPVPGDVVGDSSGAMKLSRSDSRSAEGLDKVSFRGVNENLVLETVRDQELKIKKEMKRISWITFAIVQGLLRSLRQDRSRSGQGQGQE